VLLEVVTWKIPKQSYTDEFKVEAVRLVQAGQQPAAVARSARMSSRKLGSA
jgi:hypothetical protein